MENSTKLPFSTANVSIDAFMVNMLIGIILTVLVVVHYNRYAPTTAGQIILSRVLPYVALVTLLVISVVKSSLALSLGMVGALSVIRFRTAIKDPLELGYIFISVGIGIGLGAGQTLVTVVGVLTILVTTVLLKRVFLKSDHKETLVELDTSQDNSQLLENLLNVFGKYSVEYDVRKIYVSSTSTSLVISTNTEDLSSLQNIIRDLRNIDPDLNINIIDFANIPNV